MKWTNCEPQSSEWFACRLGRLGSSEFHKVITPKTLKISSQAPGVMYRLLAEWMTGQPVENFTSEWMERGIELEDAAVRAYEALTDNETSRGGHFTTDDDLLGCSPDRLIGDDGDLELKCPLIQTQVKYALEGLDEEYKLQLQGRMMIHGRDWVDIFSFHPRLSVPPLRVFRDDKTIAIMRPVLKMFTDLMVEKRLELERRFGPFVRAAPEQIDEAREFLTEQDGEDIIAARFQ